MTSVRYIAIFIIFIVYHSSVQSQEGSGKFCIDAEPLCGSGLFFYPNTSGFNLAENGPDYGCLFLALNPAWFYFQIDQPGDIQLQIEQSTVLGNIPDLDVDFILFGPFTDPRSPCISDLNADKIKDCSFEVDFVEYVNLANTIAGEYYLLLITNFSLDSGFITVTQTAGEATTNCILVEEPIVMESQACTDVIQTLNASTANATHYQWYQEDDEGNFIEIYSEGTAFLDVSHEGIYKAEALNASNVVIEHYQFNFSFLDSSPLEINAEVVSNTFIEENNIEVTILDDSNDIYDYSIDDGPWQQESIFNNVSMGEHQISVMNSTGCRIGSTRITVMDYPLYFTPNGDGFNDTWAITGQDDLQATVAIFDRYGKLIKQILPNSSGWDGTYNGTQMPTSDYWFIVSYIEPRDGLRKQFQAHFTLKR
ncbi:T9SS type B sorting domain-containing protein [Aestuariivivens sediminis]|uniref:T9SS type B sorting domain-containing protein n=1 Tax=Aestuariivivens sediminis TaxID=2913557 RepID=UPI001F584D26|nr:T9SS type B sorting domain-containing protein [Aestuariivivens sediminis]